jgi:hypothetical protein
LYYKISKHNERGYLRKYKERGEARSGVGHGGGTAEREGAR